MEQLFVFCFICIKTHNQYQPRHSRICLRNYHIRILIIYYFVLIEKELNTNIDTRKMEILLSGINIAISTNYHINKFEYPTYYVEDCKFVNIPMPYKKVTFKEYAPKNFIYFRILYNVQFSYDISFLNSIIYGGLIQDQGSSVLYSRDRKYLIQLLDIADVNALLPMLNIYFYHFCKHPNSLLPSISGLYSLELTNKVYYYMVVTNQFPEKHEEFTKMYFINGNVELDKINESNPSEQLNEKDFEKAFPSGLGLPKAINIEFINTLNADLLLLKQFGYFNYCLVIFTEKRKILNNSGVCLIFDSDIQSYKKGVIINQEENQLTAYIAIGIFNLFNEHTSLIQDNVVNDPPIDNQEQYMKYIKNKVFLPQKK